MKCRHNSFLSRIEVDILLINLLSAALIALIALSLVTTPFNIIRVIRVILAFPFVTFFPGYLLSKILFSEEEVNTIERIALSFGTSMIIVPLIGFVLAFSPMKIELYPYLSSIYLFILITSIIGQYRPKFSIKGKHHVCLKKINLLLAFILVSLLGLFIRFYPTLNYSLYYGDWVVGNCLYHTYYTLRTGELLKRGIINTPTNFSSTIYNTLLNKAFILFQSCIFLISGFTTLNKFILLNKFFPWCGALLFPMSALIVANKVAQKKEKNISSYYLVFIFFVANFASFRLLTNSYFMADNAIMGYSFILLTIYFLLDDKTVKNRLLGILFCFFILLYYYTAALVFLIIVIIILLIQKIRKEKIISENYVLLYGIFFFAYHLYLAHDVFGSYFLTLKNAIICFGGPPAQGTMGRTIIIMSIPHLSSYLNLLLITFVITLFMYWWIKGSISREPYTNFVFYLCLGLLLVGFMFFAWRGIKGIGGRSTYIVIPFLLVLPLFLAIKERRKFIVIVSLLIVATSIIAYVPGSVLHLGCLTNSERDAVVWYCIHKAEGKFVFTDFRIGTAPVMLNCFNFTGIMEREPKAEEYLKDIYYGKSALNAFRALMKYNASFILLSEEMIDYAIYSEGSAYKPLSLEDLTKYNDSPFFGKVYDNGKAWFYLIE